MRIQFLGLLFSIATILIAPGYAQVVFEKRHDIRVVQQDQPLSLPWIGGLNSSQYGKVDLDGDDSEELILYDRSGNYYQVFKTINNQLQPANELCSFLPEAPAGWILFVDYDLDGKKDIFSNGPRGAIVYKNVSSPGQTATWQKVADPLLTTGFSGKINLVVNAADIPAITDIDSDGDIDILVYNFAIGGYIRYNKNLSMELFGNADSLEYEINTRTWGEFAECDCDLFAFNGETCEDLSNGRVTHAGGKSLLAYDADGDGDMDLLVGHEQCVELYFYENKGTVDSAFMTDYSNRFPNDFNPANFHIFPSAFLEDLDFDGVKDLVVTPGFEVNYDYGINFGKSNWFYKNTGSNAVPEFSFQKDNIIQEHMLDFGENAVPCLIDVNADGIVDLLVAANTTWNGERFSGSVVQLENKGSATQPEFHVINENYLGLASLNVIHPKLDVVDFNGDNSPDLIYSGIEFPDKTISWLFINQAGSGQALAFDINQRVQITLPDKTTINDSPRFFDVDEDGNVDLLLGKSDGALEYHRNNGNNIFELVDDSFLGIERDFSQERRNLVASIVDLDRNNGADLIATDSRGQGGVYFDFQVQQEGSYQSVDLIYKNEASGQDEVLKFDQKTWITAANIFNETTQSIVVGGVRGGLQLFQNLSIGSGGENEDQLEVRIYPNPLQTTSGLNIKSNQDVTVGLYSVLGQMMLEPFEVQKFTSVHWDIGHLRNGTYILRSETTSGKAFSQLLMVIK